MYKAGPRDVKLTQVDDIDWRSGNAYDFVRNRSFRRIIYAAGAGSVVFVAWYLYRKYNSRKALDFPISGLSVEENEQLAVARYNETGNNNNVIDMNEINQQLEHIPREKFTRGFPLEDKVVIHCCPRGYLAPSIATEPLKLETFLRVANIPYEVNFCNEFETPLLTYGENVGTNFRECVRILSEQFDVNLETDDVTPSRKTACHLVDISLENHFSWAILIWRWIHDEGKTLWKIHSMNALGEDVAPDVALRVKEATKYNAIGQLEKAEFIKTISQGIHDISAALGKHKFFQGQAPGNVDCHAFAILVQIMWNMPGSPFENQIRKYGNLVDFIKRMKEQYWPDWSELILRPVEFEENYNALSRHRSRGSSKSRRSSRSRERSEANESEEVKPLREISEENESVPESVPESVAESEMSSVPTKVSNKSALKQSAKEKKLPEPDAVTVLVKKDDLPDHSSRESTTKQTRRMFSLKDLDPVVSPTSNFVAPPVSQPTGILKAGANPSSNAPSVVKPRSGFVTASVGSTKFPVDEVNQGSTPALTKVVVEQPKSIPQQQQSRSTPDSIINVHKPTVKFAGAESTSTTIQQPQQQQQQTRQQVQQPPPQRVQSPPQHAQQQLPPLNNGNFQPAPASLIPLRATGNTHPESAAQLTMKRSVEKPQVEQARHSVLPQSQYVNYVTTQQHLQGLPAPSTSVAQDYQCQKPSAPPQQQQQQHYNQMQAPPPPSNFDPPAAYPLPPLMYNIHTQQIPRTAHPQVYAQQIQYGPSPLQQNGRPQESDGVTYSQPSLNPEELQKAAQAHFDMYMRQQQHQQQYAHQQSYNNTFHTPGAILPNYIPDPRNPGASLLRF